MTAGIIVSKDKSAQTVTGDVATDEGRGGYQKAVGITASADESAWNAVGDTDLDEAATGDGKWGTAAADENAVRLRGDVSSVDEAPRTTMWRTVTDEATTKRRSGGRRFRRSHRTAAVIIASAGNLCGRPRGRSSPSRPRRERRVEPEIAAANEVTGLPLGVSFLWTRPRPQKGGERGPVVVIHRDGCRRVAADEVAWWGVCEPELPRE